MAEYNVGQRPDETLEQYYRRLSKTADQRLVRLERYSEEAHFHGITKWAYSRAMKDIHHWNGETASRFNTAPPDTVEGLVSKINDIKHFLESVTSTKAGVKSVYIKRTNTINKRYGTSFTWEQLANYYERGTNEKWDAIFGSKTALKTIGRIQKRAKALKKDIEDVNTKDFHFHSDRQTDLNVRKALREQSLSLKDLK